MRPDMRVEHDLISDCAISADTYHGVHTRRGIDNVLVNCVDALDVATPFGGLGQSGYGRGLSLHVPDKFTGLKTTWTRRG